MTGKEDINNLVLLEHVNINVIDRNVAETFYGINGLGGCRDSNRPATRSLHVNFGPFTQAHLGDRQSEAAITESQVINGYITLVCKGEASLQSAKNRLIALKENDLMKNTKFALKGDSIDVDDCNVWIVIGPYGNTFHIRKALDCEEHLFNRELGSRKGSECSHDICIAGVTFHCDIGAAEEIESFYSLYFGMRCESKIYNGKRFCNVYNKFDDDSNCQFIRFLEDSDYCSTSMRSECQGIHIAIYIKNFELAFKKLEEHELIWVNPRFMNDSATTLKEAKEVHQFRFLNFNLKKSKFHLEHEVRDLNHPSYPLL